MTVHARLHVFALNGRQHRVHEISVTIHTRALRHSLVTRLDLNRIFVVAQGKRQRVKEPVIGLGHPFPDRIMRQMTIVTNCDVMVARVLPRIVLPLHGVAIDARQWVVTQIARPFAVTKGERAKPDEHPHQDNKEKRCTSKTTPSRL